MAGDRFGNTLKAAKNLGTLTTQPVSLQDSIGGTDQNDLGRFNLANRASLTLEVASTKRNNRAIKVDLFALKTVSKRVFQQLRTKNFSDLKPKELKQAFTFVTRSRFKRNSSPLTLTLDPGDYYFRVYGTTKATTYRLNATPAPIAIESPASGFDPPPSDASGLDTPPAPAADLPGSNPPPSPTQPTLKLNRSWIKQFGSTANDYLYGLALSSDGSQIYVSGSTNGNLLDPNTGNPVGTNAGDRDSFAAQFSSTGASQWVRQFGQTGLDAAYNIAVDASGNYFIAGINILSGLLPNPNGYLARFNASGTEQLPRTTIATQAPNPINPALPPINAGDAISSVAIDASGDLIVAGFVEAVPGSSTSKAWVARYDGATGVQEWNTELALPQSSGVSALKLDQAGNIYVTGITNATLTTDYTNPFQGGDAFVAKLSGNGTTLWQPQILATAAYDEARDIAIDQNGNIYITGATQGTLAGQSSAGDTDGFLAKYDTNGVLQWTKQFGSTGLDESQSIALDSAGRIYLTGETTGSLFGNTPMGNSDAWIGVFDNNGNLAGSTIIGTPEDEETYKIMVGSAGKVYVAGQTQGTLGATNNLGGYDAWIAEYTLS